MFLIDNQVVKPEDAIGIQQIMRLTAQGLAGPTLYMFGQTSLYNLIHAQSLGPWRDMSLLILVNLAWLELFVGSGHFIGSKMFKDAKAVKSSF